MINDSFPVDALIVGAGLAGCLMAHRLEAAGKSYRIVGNTDAPAAYKVAAGVINPVTGRWMTKSWEIDQLLPVAEATYRAIEARFQIEIYHPVPLQRFCQNTDDAKRLGRRMRNPRYENVLGRHLPPGSGPDAIKDTQGSFEILGAAYVDLPLLIETLQAHFEAEGTLIRSTFEHSMLSRQNESWQYGNIQARRVLFCEGVGIEQNPWFNKLPLTPAKGETLILKGPGLDLPKTLYHHKKWLLPYGEGHFRLGATYDESDRVPMPTDAAKAELLQALDEFIRPNIDWTIEHHLAGIRPTTSDAKPLLGKHAVDSDLYVLNGLGSKGASLAPLLSQQLFDYIFHQAPLWESVDICRFETVCD